MVLKNCISEGLKKGLRVYKIVRRKVHPESGSIRRDPERRILRGLKKISERNYGKPFGI